MTLKFEIYKNGERVTQFVPVDAMALGPESVPWPGSVSFRDDLLIVSRAEDHASAVSLLWDIGQRGAYQMETTRLPPRAKPYVLNVELARFRLMKIVQKQEDWNLFDFPKTEKLQTQFREAQGLFAQALAHLDVPAAASKLADRSMEVSFDLSEELAKFHAELLLNRRRTTNSLPRHLFGCVVDWTVQSPVYREKVFELCDFVVMPMPWKVLQPSEEVFLSEQLDEWVEMLAKRRMLIIAGPLIDLSNESVPDWLYIWEHDFDTLRDLAYDFVRKVVSRYRRAVTAWNVTSGLHASSNFSLSFEQMIDMTRLLVQQVRTIAPTARTIVSIQQPFGEYHARPNAAVPPMLYADMVAQSGIQFDAFGLEFTIGSTKRGSVTRDLFQLSCMLDRFSTLGKPMFLTGIGAPDNALPDAGRLRDGYSPARQAKWLEEFSRIALSKPYIENVCWSNFSDLSTTLPGGGLLDESMQHKPIVAASQTLRETLGKPAKKA